MDENSNLRLSNTDCAGAVGGLAYASDSEKPRAVPCLGGGARRKIKPQDEGLDVEPTHADKLKLWQTVK